MSCRTRVVYHHLYARRGFTALHRTVNRYGLFLDRFRQSPLRDVVPFVESPAATEQDILQAHAPEYLDLIQSLDLAGEGRLDGSTPAWRGMYARAERVVGGSLLGADLIAAGYAHHVFNPAGGQHHARYDRGGGFCVFNDVVVAVRRFQRYGFRRIAVVDVDGHHGDGTESLLSGEQVLTVSLHQFGGRTYPGTGASADRGSGAGEGFCMNLPISEKTGGAVFRELLEGTVAPVLSAYRPEVLIAEFGTDGHSADPLLRLRLGTDTYRWIARWMHGVAHELCDGRLLVVGGGGYEPDRVTRCWLLMLAELAGIPPERSHRRGAEWLAEPPLPPEEEADRATLRAAFQTRACVFPAHNLTP